MGPLGPVEAADPSVSVEAADPSVSARVVRSFFFLGGGSERVIKEHQRSAVCCFTTQKKTAGVCGSTAQMITNSWSHFMIVGLEITASSSWLESSGLSK